MIKCSREVNQRENITKTGGCLKMRIKIFGAGKTVTGSCYSLATKEEKILIDCGMFQGSKDLERLNYADFTINPKEYSALILTHAHLDHCGRIPKLVKYGFRGKIFATDATRDLAEIIMLDSANIAKKDTAYENERRATCKKTYLFRRRC